MNPRVSGILLFAIVAATFVTGGIVYAHVGNAPLAFGLPIVLLILWGLWALLPAVDPIAKGFHGFRYIYDFIWILISAVLAYSYALTLYNALGEHVDTFKAILPAIALLIFTCGALFPGIPRNWFFGIRTPWTLSSDKDWKATHQFSSPLFMSAGILIFIGAFMPRAWSVWFVLVPVLLCATISIIYSYLVFKRS